jgi:hypothetical protein
MPRPSIKPLLFTTAELHNLRLGFYTQAPTVAALLSTIPSENRDGDEVYMSSEEAARETVILIENLIAEIAEVER